MYSKSIGTPESESADDDGSGSAGGGGVASGPRKSMKEKVSMLPKGNKLVAGTAAVSECDVCGVLCTELRCTHLPFNYPSSGRSTPIVQIMARRELESPGCPKSVFGCLPSGIGTYPKGQHRRIGNSLSGAVIQICPWPQRPGSEHTRKGNVAVGARLILNAQRHPCHC